MKRFFLTIMAVLLAINMSAQDNEIYWTPDNIPMVYLEDSTQYVSNPDGILNDSTVAQINRILRKLETDKGVQTVVIAVKHIKDDDPYSFGMSVVKKYGVGNKKNYGLFVMICPGDRSYTILSGDGLEGTLPDALCSQIQRRIMVPYLKEEKHDSAMIATIDAIDGYIRGDDTIINTLKSSDEDGDLTPVLLFFVFVIGIIWLVIALSRKKCPQCKKGTMEVTKKELVEIDGKKKFHVHYKCKKCGFEMDEYQDPPSNNSGSSAGRIGGGMIGMGGFGSRGGGSIGGHFGGGHFSGGGSTGRY